MFFSVIVPVYKVEKYLTACIESVLGQSFSDFELILVDDGSPDSCPQICDDYAAKDSRIKVVHKENGGLASARKAGIKIAEGEYVFNLDSDDAIVSDTLEFAHKAICETNCDIVSFGYKWVDDSGTPTGFTNDGIDEGFYNRERIEKEIFPRLLMNENMEHIAYYLAGKAVRRELLLPNQLAVDEKISLGEDLCCTLLCYLEAKSAYLTKKEAYLYTRNEASISKKFNADQILLIETAVNSIKDRCLDCIPGFEEQLFRYSFFMCLAIVAAAAEGGHFASIPEIERNILNSSHMPRIKKASFKKISPKSRITLFFMKRGMIKPAFYFLNLCKKMKEILRKG